MDDKKRLLILAATCMFVDASAAEDPEKKPTVRELEEFTDGISVSAKERDEVWDTFNADREAAYREVTADATYYRPAGQEVPPPPPAAGSEADALGVDEDIPHTAAAPVSQATLHHRLAALVGCDAAEVLSFRETETEVIVVTRSGQKLRGAK